MDGLLLPLLRSAHEPESEDGLARLIEEQAAPVVRAIIRKKLRAGAGDHLSRQEADDLCGEVVVRLLARLRAFVADPAGHPIGDFRGYAAVTAYNACHLYLRKRYPARWRLKNRLRYTLTRHTDFALWQVGEDEWRCGLSAWRDRRDVPADAGGRLRQFAEGAPRPAGLTPDPARAELPDLLRAVFTHVGGPLSLDELLGVVAEVQGVRDHPAAGELTDEDLGARPGEVSETFATEVERRSYLGRLWEEITLLPPLQRAALLLNLRDAHEGVIALLPLAGVAGLRQIAEAVRMPAAEFAALWNQLPLDDESVAARLGVTRQQVVNLRKAARARLARRMRPHGEPP